MIMKKRLKLVLLFCLPTLMGFATDVQYPVSAIPEELKKDVHAVVRENKIIYRIVSQNRATVYCYTAVTIFNENAKNHAILYTDYDKLTKIVDFNASAYDATGKLIKKLKNSEIQDQSIIDNGTMFSDDRVKFVDLSQSTYPYTVVFEYEKEYKFLYLIDAPTILDEENLSVQHTSYEIIYPVELAPRYKTINVDQKPTKKKLDDNLESISWEFSNIKAIKYEPLSNANDFSIKIMAAPSKFEFDGYQGEMKTWNEYGKWISSLNKGRDILPEETKKKIRDITLNCKTIEEKTKKVFEYLQGRTRYVGIQLGIGGYQPFEASVVDKTGYGDCKALSNYTVALLAEVGVRANYVLINAGKNASKMTEDFPCNQFNHATVCVPNNADTLWLECTDQTVPFAYAGYHTGNRKALAITETGASVVRTPVYKENENIQSRTAEVYVELSGNAKAKTKTTYSGLQYENDHLSFILDNQFDDQKKWIQRNTGIPSFDINSFSIKNNKNKVPSAIVSLDLNLNRLATVSGKRMFLLPNLMNRSTFIPEKVENRKTNVVLKTAFTDFDTIKYHLPEELYPEYLPEPVKLKSRFGEYEATYKIDQGNLIYIRKMKRLEGEFPPESYTELIDFYKSIAKADNSKIVFLNKT
jgi:hypothetical protein